LPRKHHRHHNGPPDGYHNGSQCDQFCSELKKYEGQFITLRTRSGDTIQGTMEEVTDSGLVKIIQQGMLSPFMDDQLTVIRIIDIEHFTVPLSQDESSS